MNLLSKIRELTARIDALEATVLELQSPRQVQRAQDSGPRRVSKKKAARKTG